MSKGAILGLILKGDPLVTGLAAAEAETFCELADFMDFLPDRDSDWFKPTIHLIADLSTLGIATAFNSDDRTCSAANTIANLTVEHNFGNTHGERMALGRLVDQTNLEKEIESLEALAEVVTLDFLRQEILQEAAALRQELNAMRQTPTLSPWAQNVVDGIQAPIHWTSQWNRALDRGVEYVCDLADNLPQVSFYNLLSQDLRVLHSRASYWVGENVPVVGPYLQREYDRFINTPMHPFILTEISMRVGSTLLHLPESYGGAGLYLGTIGVASGLQTGPPFLRSLIRADATQTQMPLWSARWAGSGNQEMKILRDQVGKIKGVKYTQRHHIISDKHKATKDHRLWKLAGVSPQNSMNKMLLPTKKGADLSTTLRSIHEGRHLDEVSKNLAESMSKAVEKGRLKKWSQEQYKAELKKIIQEERQLMKEGIRALNKNKRGWAE